MKLKELLCLLRRCENSHALVTEEIKFYTQVEDEMSHIPVFSTYNNFTMKSGVPSISRAYPYVPEPKYTISDVIDNLIFEKIDLESDIVEVQSSMGGYKKGKITNISCVINHLGYISITLNVSPSLWEKERRNEIKKSL